MSQQFGNMPLHDQAAEACAQKTEVRSAMKDILWTLGQNSRPLDERLRECLHWLEVQDLITVNGQNVFINDPEEV
jgi:hypothetical protein